MMDVCGRCNDDSLLVGFVVPHTGQGRGVGGPRFLVLMMMDVCGGCNDDSLLVGAVVVAASKLAII